MGLIDDILDGESDNVDWTIEFDADCEEWCVYLDTGDELELVGCGRTLREALTDAHARRQPARGGEVSPDADPSSSSDPDNAGTPPRGSS